MISAIDTNILLDVLRPNPEFLHSSQSLLDRAAAEGTLIICSVVYAELGAHFEKRADLDHFLKDGLIRVEPIESAEAYVAGRLWRAYRDAGGGRERIISDFLIGAHALRRASRLLSRDRGFFRAHFAHLEVLGQ